MPGFSGTMIMQSWPNIYVANKTGKQINDIYFTMDGYTKPDVKVKKVKSGATTITAIYNKGYIGTRTLYLYHYDENNYKYQYAIYDKLVANYSNNIKVTIKDIKEDGTLVLDVIIDYDPLKTH
ncbi:hypothetical protein [Clostridium folliculivorans]|uniref:Uncharacterized protein n=1 Tax=Clostridium folliculivorans TaxID=2886038 RepID=A0A9W6DAA1_9CLOT|nr:hypothetical protein [Clostridium folliculivorans]GKU24617.1 hypothetical protein CFOLD11_14430 [Clostridium folliculivorans]GKU30715.1 hypothetical protein CFB3_28220 [Clostridium folliculivorans]